MWKVSEYGVFSDPYFVVFGLNMEIYGVNTSRFSLYSVRIRENTDQKKFLFGDFSRTVFQTALNIFNASITTYYIRYYISYNSCFSYQLILVVPIYCINHLLLTSTPISLVLLLGTLISYLHQSRISIVIVSATPLGYFYYHSVSAIM